MAYRLPADVLGCSHCHDPSGSTLTAGSPLRFLASCMLLGMLSCSPLRKVGECKRMVDTVNGGLSRVALSAADAGANPATYMQMAHRYEELAQDLQSASSGDETLNKTLAAYRELIQRAAKHSREFSEELDRPASTPEEDREKEARLSRLRAQARNEVNREASLVRKLNSLCHTH